MGVALRATLAEAERARDALFGRLLGEDIIGLAVEPDGEGGYLVTAFVPHGGVNLPSDVDGVQLRTRVAQFPHLQ